MAASVYATPPPDFSGDDTVLSDVSNSSQISCSNNSKRIKRSLSATSLVNTTLAPCLSNSSNGTTQSLLLDSMQDNSKKRRKQSTPIRISATTNINDTSGNPLPLNTSESEPLQHEPSLSPTTMQQDQHQPITSVTPQQLPILSTISPSSMNDDQISQKTLPKIFLSSLVQLQAKLPAFVKHDSNNINSLSGTFSDNDMDNDKCAIPDSDDGLESGEISGTRMYSNNINCDQCGMRLESEVKLRIHMIQEHDGKDLSTGTMNSLTDVCFKINVKKEPNDHQEWDSNDQQQQHQQQQQQQSQQQQQQQQMLQRSLTSNGTSKPEDWLSLAGLPFPFPPEAAAMLSASGYLSQLPLLGVPSSVPSYTSDGISRSNVPPLRIFNPEAYCDLCNKEFCNKYFLKTHKANKHSIYEPIITTNELATASQLNHMSQVFQMQQQHQEQQQHQQQLQLQQQQPQQQIQQPQQQPQQPTPQQQQVLQQSTQQSQPQQSQQQPQTQHSPQPLQTTQPQLSPTNNSSAQQEPSVYCDVCLKRFTNVFAMRRHRSKSHEIPPPTAADLTNTTTIKFEGKLSAGASNTSVPFTIPEGFREDFSIEQEEASFTPQPRKLSPSSSQQARESNFSVDKLKRLGVINPEAFCELCCKEYCNKYFLRTHKIKRHGIFMTSDEIKEEANRIQLPANTSLPAFVQTSPLNLMMSTNGGSSGTNAGNVTGIIEQQLSLYQTQRKLFEHATGAIRKMSTDSLDDFDTMKKDAQLTQQGELKKLSAQELQQQLESVAIAAVAAENSKLSSAVTGTTDESNIAGHHDADTIGSVDLQKLQSMILQLNDLNAQRPTSCSLCGKELENQYALHAHMMSEHTQLADTFNGLKTSASSSPTGQTSTKIEMCKQCDKEFKNGFALAQHLYECHGIQPTSPIRDGFITPERPISNMSLPNIGAGGVVPGDRRPYTITPTSSYCEICNKELCNKYFMKTHMQRMHGIEIENGAQIGGVICNICNKELCSKYFLRVHKHNTHGIVDEGSPLAQPRQNGDQLDTGEAMFPIDVTGLKPGEISELSNRYFTHFTEVCPLCNRRFRGSKWLRTHLMTDHGKAGTDKLKELELTLGVPKSTSPTLKIPNGAFSLNPTEPNFLHKQSLSNLFSSAGGLSIGSNGTNSNGGINGSSGGGGSNEPVSSTSKTKEYHCTFCSFTTPSYAFLFIHERSHTFLAAGGHQSSQQQQQQHQQHNQSESAVSIAKDQQRCIQPTSSSGVTTSSETPTSTPATTPVPVPLTSHESAFIKQQPTTADLPPITHNMLSDAANLLQRPAVYAIPQSSDGMVMQSFLLEEVHRNNGENASEAESTQHSAMSSDNTRFVPSIVFLPVKERISNKLVVSFTLTPA